jgi:hypothetical protein
MTESLIFPSALLFFLFIRKIFNFSYEGFTLVFTIVTIISIVGTIMRLFQGSVDYIDWYHTLWAALLGVGYYLYYQVFMICGTYALWLEKRKALRLPENTAHFMAVKVEKIAAINDKIEIFHSDKKRKEAEMKFDIHKQIVGKLTSAIQTEYEIFCPNKKITFEKECRDADDYVLKHGSFFYKVLIENIEIVKIYCDREHVSIHSIFQLGPNKSKEFKFISWKIKKNGNNDIESASKFCLEILKDYCRLKPELFL